MSVAVKSMSTSTGPRRITQTYGKRGARAKNARSTSLVAAPTDESSQEDTDSHEDHGEDHQAKNDVSRPVLSVPVSADSTAGPSVGRNLPSTASTSLVPEVVIYSPKRTRTVSNPESQPSKPSQSFLPSARASEAYGEPIRKPDLKGKGRMSEPAAGALESATDSTSSDSDCVLVSTRPSHPEDLHYSQDSEEDLLDSATLYTPRRSRKRRISSSPESTAGRKSRRGSDGYTRKSLPSSAYKNESTGRSGGHIAPPLQQRKKPGLKETDSMDSLFDELFTEAKDKGYREDASPAPVVRASLLAQMGSRPVDRDSASPSIGRSPSVTSSPVRLERKASQTSSYADQPGSAHPHPAEALKRTQSASLAFQGAMGSSTDLKHGTQALQSSTLPSRPLSNQLSRFPSRSSSPAIDGSFDSQTRQSLRKSASQSTLLDELALNLNRSLSEDDDEEDKDGINVVLNSVNQLRSAGENRRFTDEMHYLLEGLEESQPLSVHRANAVEILRKTEDEDFLRKLKVYDFVPQVYAALRSVKAGEGDIILDNALLLFLFALCTDKQTIESLLQHSNSSGSSLLDALRILYDRNLTAAESGYTTRSTSKSEKRLLDSLDSIGLRVLHQQEQGKSFATCTAHDLVVRTLYSIYKHIRHPLRTFFHAGLVKPILRTAQNELLKFDPSMVNTDGTYRLNVILDLLEALVGGDDQEREGNAEAASMETEIPKLLNGLGRVVQACALQFRKCAGFIIGNSSGILLRALKVLVLLADSSSTCSEALCSDGDEFLLSLMDCIKGNGTSSARALPTVQAVAASQANIIAASSETPSDNAMDTEISLLSLGLLETVLETTPKARGIFKQLYVGNDCEAECWPKCSCSSKTLASTHMCRMLAASLSTISQDHTQIFAGYASLVIIYGCLGSRIAVESALKALRDNVDALSLVRNAVEELLKLHHEADQIGLDASKTSASELRAMLLHLNSANDK